MLCEPIWGSAHQIQPFQQGILSIFYPPKFANPKITVYIHSNCISEQYYF